MPCVNAVPLVVDSEVAHPPQPHAEQQADEGEGGERCAEHIDLGQQASNGHLGQILGLLPPHGYDLRYESGDGEFLFIVRYMPDGSKQIMNARGRRTHPREKIRKVTRTIGCAYLAESVLIARIGSETMITDCQNGVLFKYKRMYPANRTCRIPIWSIAVDIGIGKHRELAFTPLIIVYGTYLERHSCE